MDLNPNAFDFIPPTFVLPQEETKLKEYMKKHPNACYIGKPQSGAKGDGIFLFRELKDLTWKKTEEILIQRYIDKPLCLDGLKFDLRLYVPLIRTGSDMHAFVADEGLARFCTAKYEKPTT
jgi:hypothetical protein